MEYGSSTIAHLDPEIVMLDGEFVPSKNINYKTEVDGSIDKWGFKTGALAYERAKRKEMLEELKGVKEFPTSQEVHVAITFGMPTQKKYDEADIDNKAKTLLDAMVGPVYKDDRQVKVLWINKALEPDGEDWCLLSVKILGT